MFKKIVNIGVRPGYEPWEIYLTRKLNTITLISIFNIFVSLLFYWYLDIKDFIPLLLIVLVIGPTVILFNRLLNYVWAAYAFYIIGFIFMIFLNLIMGKDSYVVMFYFPVMISMVQLLGRRETAVHLIPLGLICMLSIIIILIGFSKGWLYYKVSPEMQFLMIYFNILLSLFTALSFIGIVVVESLKQEKVIKSMLVEKEILLAEVFHRVKNNMNIVTSLLNLKKSTSDSPVVHAALDDCRNRVYSMALVHHKIFNRDNIIGLNFNDYIKELVNDLMHSLGGDNVMVSIEADDINLNLTTAIPCGLILNELITNSMKYAKIPGKEMCITIKVSKICDNIELQVSDNGPGIPEHAINKFNSLGLELIKSLSEQIDGDYKFSTNNGLVFNLRFRLA